MAHDPAPRPSPVRAALRHLVDVRDGEARGLLWSFAYFLSLLSAYTMLKPLRDEMAIAGGLDRLEWLFTATFAGTLVAVPVFSAAAARFPRRTFVPWVYRVSAASLVGYFGLWEAGAAPALVASSFFVWVSVFNLFITSVFWAFLADVFSSEQAKRLFGFVAAGGTAGAIAGPLLAAVLAPAIGPAAVALIAAGVFELAARCASRVARWSRAGASGDRIARAIGGSPFAGFTLLVRSPYLLAIAAQTLLFAITTTILYAQYLGLVEAALADPGRRTALFGYVEAGGQALTLLIQLALSGRVLVRFGLGPALAAQPALTAAGFFGIGFVPLLAPAVGLWALRRSVHHAIERPAREALFTAVSPEARYKAKSLIDTVVYRGGDAVSAWLNAGLAALGLGVGGIVLAASPLALVGIGIAIFLGRRHGRELGEERG